MNKERQLGNVTATDPLLKNSIPLLDNVSSKRRSLCLDSLRVPLPHIDNASPLHCVQHGRWIDLCLSGTTLQHHLHRNSNIDVRDYNCW